MKKIRAARLVAYAFLFVALLFVAGCGGGSNDDGSGGTSKSLRAAALSLQQAMDSSSRAIDGLHGTRDSLDNLRAVLQPATAQTSDVIGLLSPKADAANTESMLLKAAREQRSFLQFAADATDSRSRRAGNSAMVRTRSAGRRASAAYADVAQEVSALAGSLPSATTFNTGRLLDAVQKVNRRKAGGSRTSDGSAGGGASGAGGAATTSCGDGISVNSVTSCPFGRAVRDEYESSGGASEIEAFSPATNRSYTMSCSGAVPTVCRGGNGAVVTIR